MAFIVGSERPLSTLTQETLKMTSVKQSTWCCIYPITSVGSLTIDVIRAIFLKKFRIFHNRFDKSSIDTKKNHNNFHNFLGSINK